MRVEAIMVPGGGRMGRFALLLAVLILGSSGVHGLEIWEIQGSGLRSDFENQAVTTNGNIVTAVGEGVFFIQSPNGRADGDPWTSDGVFVNHSGAPPVEVGDRVSLSGTVREYYGQTEIGGAVTVTVVSKDHPLPDIIDLDSSVPTADQPWPETELERFEGMRVRVAEGMITGPTDSYGDAWATANGRRAFREPGIHYPGLPNLPVWDGNPEVFEIDPDALGGEAQEFAAGTRFSSEGVLAFVFGSYQLWPRSLELASSLPLPVPASVPVSRTLTIASQNLERLARSGGDLPYDDRLDKLSLQIREVLGRPDIVAVQEVDSLSVLGELADRIESDDVGPVYRSYLVEGNDPSGIDVGFLVSGTVTVDGVEQIGADVMFTWDGSRLFDRPPLVLSASRDGLDVTVVVVHLKSLGGVEDPGSNGDRVRRKRFEQSEWLADWLQDRQRRLPGESLLVIGDFNAFEFSDGYVDVVGQISGSPDPAGALLPASEIVDPPLVVTASGVSSENRYSYIYRGSAEVLDHALVNRNLAPLIREVSYSRGNADAPDGASELIGTAVGSSDHDGLVLSIGPRVRHAGGRRSP